MAELIEKLDKLLKKLNKNRFFRLALRGLKLCTLFLFGICLVSFFSAVTQLFYIADLYIDRLMTWGLGLIVGFFILLGLVIAAIALYECVKVLLQRRQRRREAAAAALKKVKPPREVIHR
ncbi:MAG: hypothetical protein ACFB5Z_11935 [Elainellaceae cyanobacterium]